MRNLSLRLAKHHRRGKKKEKGRSLFKKKGTICPIERRRKGKVHAADLKRLIYQKKEKKEKREGIINGINKNRRLRGVATDGQSPRAIRKKKKKKRGKERVIIFRARRQGKKKEEEGRNSSSASGSEKRRGE